MPIQMFDRKRIQASQGAGDDDESPASSDLKSLAGAVKMAFDSGDEGKIASALKAFFYKCEQEPHEEEE